MARDLTMRRCPKCGVPLVAVSMLRWRNSGRITLPYSEVLKMAIINSDVYHTVFSRMEENLGYSIGHLLFEAHRNVSRTSFEDMPRVFPGLGPYLHTDFGKKSAVFIFNMIARLFGLSRCETLDYVPGEWGIARFMNPYHRELMAANVVGAFEFLDGCPYEYELNEYGEQEFIVKVWPSESKPKFSERLEANIISTIPGEVKLPVCRRCRVPYGISERLKWIDGGGCIVDRYTNARMIVSPSYTLTTVVRELAEELGEEVYELLVKAKRDWVVEHIEQMGIADHRGAHTLGEIHEVYRQYLMNLPLYGHGNPVNFKVEASHMEVVVENPFDVHLIAGTIQGLFEALTKEKCDASWETKRENVVAYYVSK